MKQDDPFLVPDGVRFKESKSYDPGGLESDERLSQLAEETQSRKLKNKLLEQKIENRRKIWGFTSAFLLATIVISYSLILLSGWSFAPFNLDASVQIALMYGVPVETIGVLYVVANHVFKDEKEA